MTGMQSEGLASVGRMGRKHGVVGVAVLHVPSETTCLFCDGGCTAPGARELSFEASVG